MKIPIIQKISIDKSWKFNLQVLILIMLGLLVITILGVIILSFLKKEASLFEVPQVKMPILPQPPKETEEILKPGDIGEVSEKEAGEIPTGYPGFPPVIFNTTGKIIEIKDDRIIVEGSGSNFADQKPRTLIVLFSPSTFTFEPGQKIRHQGIDGLKFLKTGMEVLIEGEENIRGKNQFIARTINII